MVVELLGSCRLQDPHDEPPWHADRTNYGPGRL